MRVHPARDGVWGVWTCLESDQKLICRDFQKLELSRHFLEVLSVPELPNGRGGMGRHLGRLQT